MKNKTKLRFMAALLCFVMLLSLNVTALADQPAPQELADKTEGVEMAIAGQATAVHNQAIVLIPGIGGSELYYGTNRVWVGLDSVLTPSDMNYLKCDSSGKPTYSLTVCSPSTSKADGGARSYYDTMYAALHKAYSSKYDVLFFPYDWRISNATSAASLALAINNTYDNVILVAHSMGGLVASKYCANSSVNRDKVDKLITIGTPYTGAPKLVYVAETGDFNPLLNDNKIKELINNFSAVYQLIPTTRYADNYSSYIQVGSTNYSGSSARNYIASRPWATNNGTTKSMYDTATTFHSGLLLSGTHVANGSLVDTYKIVGSGIDTASKIVYDSSGNYLKVELNNSGDGTVPRYSASNTQTISTANHVYSVSGVDHMKLMDNSAVIQKVKEIIDGTLNTSLSNADETITTNEKGWLNGEDNRRIYITLDYNENLTICDHDGNPFIAEGSYLYDVDGVNVGSIWKLGGEKVMFCMKNGEYSVTSENTFSPLNNITITYQNNGYDEYSEVYESLNAQQLKIDINDYSKFEVQCMIRPFLQNENNHSISILVPVEATDVINNTNIE